MEQIEKLAEEIKTANPVRKMMLAQELLPLLVQQLRDLRMRVNDIETDNAARKS